MIKCKFTIPVDGDFAKCKECGAIGFAGLVTACPRKPDWDIRIQQPARFQRGQFVPSNDENGVGAELLVILKRNGFPSCDLCRSLARRMNTWGPDECERKRDTTIVPQMIANAKQHPKMWVKVMANTTPKFLAKHKLAQWVDQAILTERTRLETESNNG